jgi:hypothetical protein
MTQVCYTIEQAAEKLGMSETVLVRLSQYFKIPVEAYEPEGFLSFKGELTFAETDLRFFRMVRERLLAGESLEDVRARLNDRPSAIAITPDPPADPYAFLRQPGEVPETLDYQSVAQPIYQEIHPSQSTPEPAAPHSSQPLHQAVPHPAAITPMQSGEKPYASQPANRVNNVNVMQTFDSFADSEPPVPVFTSVPPTPVQPARVMPTPQTVPSHQAGPPKPPPPPPPPVQPQQVPLAQQVAQPSPVATQAAGPLPIPQTATPPHSTGPVTPRQGATPPPSRSSKTVLKNLMREMGHTAPALGPAVTPLRQPVKAANYQPKADRAGYVSPPQGTASQPTHGPAWRPVEQAESPHALLNSFQQFDEQPGLNTPPPGRFQFGQLGTQTNRPPRSPGLPGSLRHGALSYQPAHEPEAAVSGQ